MLEIALLRVLHIIRGLSSRLRLVRRCLPTAPSALHRPPRLFDNLPRLFQLSREDFPSQLTSRLLYLVFLVLTLRVSADPGFVLAGSCLSYPRTTLPFLFPCP